MKQELDEKLCAAYPKLFRDRHADMRTTAMCWGFDCGDGWYNIINHLCSNIQGHIDWRLRQIEVANDYNKELAEAKAGDFTSFERRSQAWAPVYREKVRAELLAGEPRAVPEEIPQVVVQQVKEKFGTLRFYYAGGDDYIRGLTSMAESMSACTCEECGAPGKSIGGGWVTTLCETHATERGIVYNEDEEPI